MRSKQIIPDKTKQSLADYRRGWKAGFVAAMYMVQDYSDKKMKEIPYHGEQNRGSHDDD